VTETDRFCPVFFWTVKRLALPLMAVGILAACGAADDGTTQQAATAPPIAPAATTAASQPASPATAVPAPVTAEPAPSTPVNVPEALKFAAPLIGGGDIELTTLAGRPVLLWFWAPW